MRGKFKWISVILILSISQSSDFANCPTGSGNVCTITQNCNGTEHCFQDLDNSADSHCCNILCPTTKLMTFHIDTNTGFYFHKMTDKMDQELYYSDPDTSIACPFPYSRTTIKLGKYLPVGFSVNSSDPVKTCKTNGDCGDGQYCGESVNPSFSNPFDSKDQKLLTEDKSDNNNAMRFCYKAPVRDEFKAVIDSTSIGLHFCFLDVNCPKDTICLILDQPLLSNQGRNGLCVNVDICNNHNNSTRSFGVLTKNGSQCSTASDCDGLQDNVLSPECVSFQYGNSTKGSLCCFQPRSCQYGTAKIPRIPCNTSENCNNGTSPWTSWCDKDGFCCQDDTGTVPFLCPDGATLALDEPECDKSCQNGTCIDGHCCPGLKYENGKAQLAKSPYKTKMPCDVTKPLPPHIKHSYCSSDGFVVVIGTHDAFGEILFPGKEMSCSINSDCVGAGFEYCINGEQNTACFRNPYKELPKPTEAPFYWNVQYYVTRALAVVLVVGVCIGICICIAKVRRVTNRFNQEIRLIASELFLMFSAVLLTGRMPQFTYRNIIEIVTMGWKKYAALHNVPAYLAKCYYDYAVMFLAKLRRREAKLREMAQINALPIKGVYIPRETSIKDADIEKGNTPRPDIELDNVVYDTNENRRCGTEPYDILQLDSSTEISSLSDSLRVERTQSDSSLKTAISNIRNAAGRLYTSLFSPIPNIRDDDLEKVLDQVFRRFKRIDEEDKAFLTIIVLSDLKAVDSPKAAYSKLDAMHHKKSTNKKKKQKKSKILKIVKLPFSTISSITETIVNVAGFGSEEEIEGNYVAHMTPRHEAGRDKRRIDFGEALTLSEANYKKNTPELSWDERLKILKNSLGREQTGVSDEDMHVQIANAYIGKIGSANRKDLLMEDALKLINKALEKHPNSIRLLERKALVILMMVNNNYGFSMLKECKSTFDKLIELSPCANYIYSSARISFALIDLSRVDRFIVTRTILTPDIQNIVEYMKKAEKMEPNAIRNLLLMAKIEFRYGKKDTGVAYLEKALQIRPKTEEDKKRIVEAKKLFDKYKQFHA